MSLFDKIKPGCYKVEALRELSKNYKLAWEICLVSKSYWDKLPEILSWIDLGIYYDFNWLGHWSWGTVTSIWFSKSYEDFYPDWCCDP